MSEEKVDLVEQVACKHERQGNALLASGLVLQARRQFRIADAIRSQRVPSSVSPTKEPKP